MTTPAPETGTTGTPPAGTGTAPPPEGQAPPAPEGTPPPTTPPPAETVEFWKQKSREQEARAKANADAAKELEKIKEGQKTEAQKQQEANAQAAKEAADARAETARWKAAAAHGVDETNFDLLGTGTDQEVGDRAKRVGALLAAAAELKTIKDAQAAQQGQPPPPPPTGAIKGLNPGAPTPPDNSYPEGWFPQLARKRSPAEKDTVHPT